MIGEASNSKVEQGASGCETAGEHGFDRGHRGAPHRVVPRQPYNRCNASRQCFFTRSARPVVDKLACVTITVDFDLPLLVKVTSIRLRPPAYWTRGVRRGVALVMTIFARGSQRDR